MPIDYTQQKAALLFLEIDIGDWNKLTTDARRKKYHALIVKTILRNHPDKHHDLSTTDPTQYAQLIETTKLLNSVNYDYGTEESAPEQMASSSDSSNNGGSDFGKKTYTYTDRDKKFEFTFEASPPRNLEELIDYLKRDPQFYGNQDKRNWKYYEKVKEMIPNIISYAESFGLDSFLFGPDISFVLEQVVTKLYLKGYDGADDFVSALVSRDEGRIKSTFDQMIINLSEKSFLFNLFQSRESRLDGFVGKFCEFEPKEEMGGMITGIHLRTVLVLCHALSLKLPYQIIDLNEGTDQELVRTLLKRYVSEKAHLKLDKDKDPTEERKLTK